MDEIVNKFLLAGDNFIPEIHLSSPDSLTVLGDHLVKTKKEFRNLKKQDILDITIGMS